MQIPHGSPADDLDDGSRAAREFAVGPSLRRPARRRRGFRRACLTATAFVVSLLCVGLIGGGVFFARLSQGAIDINLRPQILAALNERVGHGYTVDLAGTTIEATENGPALTISDLTITDSAHRPIVRAPKAAISVSATSLMVGAVAPTRLELRDVDVRLVILADGEVAVSAGSSGTAYPIASAFTPQAGPDHARPVADRVGTILPNDHAPVAGESKATPAAQPANAAVRALATALRSLVDATTAPDSAFKSLDRVAVTGRLVLDDRTHNVTTVFSNTVLGFDKAADGSAVLSVAADGPAGRWSLVARASRAQDATKSLTVEARDISLDEITLAGGLRGVGFDFDMPLSASLAFQLGSDGTLQLAQGRFSMGAGYFKLDDPDHEPLLVDSITGGFHLDPSTNGIDIDPTELHAGGSAFTMTGHVDLPKPDKPEWIVNTLASGTFGTERPGEKPIKIARAGVAMRVLPEQRRLIVDKIDVSGPEVAYDMTADAFAEGKGFRLKSTNRVGRMPAQALVRLWPSFIAAPVRAWFLANLHGGWVERGTATVNLTDADLALMRVQRSVPDDHVHLDFAVSDLALSFMPGVPPLTSLDGSGVVTGMTVDFDATRGQMDSSGHRLTLADGNFHVPNSDPKPTPATISAHVLGTVEAVADVLSLDALKRYANVPVDNGALHGQVDSRLSIAMRLGDNVPADEAKITASATATNVSADNLIGKEGLVDTTLTLSADRSGIRAKGDGRMFGAPATIEIKKPAGGGASEAVINLTLDDAARAKAGLKIGKGLAGVVAARVSTSLTPGEKTKADVELDFTKASMEGLIPGFSKPAGKAGRATMTVLQRSNGTSLDGIVFEGGGATVRGSAELDGSGGFVSAKLSQLRLSPGDDLKVDVSQGADALKLVARGANVDARPFIKWLGTSGPGGAPEREDEGKNIDLDLHANVLTGQNGQAMTGTDLRMARRGGQLKRLQLTGRFGRQQMSVTTVAQSGVPHFLVESADAGASLAFLDLYKRMAGGRMTANLVMSGTKLDGSATVRDFTIRQEPAMQKLAAEGLASQKGTGRPEASGIDTSSVPFTKLEASFSKLGNRVDVKDGALYGPEIGATISGTLDFARDQVNLSGTFVPLYGVNNLFSQVPLFGPILGGGQREGLFGLNYRISGAASSPTLSVNPLSALAPGFLRQIFGAIDDAAQGDSQPRDRASGPAPAASDQE